MAKSKNKEEVAKNNAHDAAAKKISFNIIALPRQIVCYLKIVTRKSLTYASTYIFSFKQNSPEQNLIY